MRRLTIIALLGALAAFSFADEPAQPFLHLKRAPYVQRVASDSGVVCWRTLGKSVPSLRYGSAPDKLDQVIPAEKIVWGAACYAEARFEPGVFITGPMIRAYRGQIYDSGGTYHHEAVLTGLKPGSKTYYAVYHKDTLIAGGTAEHFIRTTPKPGADQPVRLWVVGDSATGGLAQRLVYGAMWQHIAKDGKPLDAMLQIGGLSIDTRRGHLGIVRFFEGYADTLRNTCAWPTPAADDVWNVFTDSFVLPTKGECGGVPSDTEMCYAFEIGRVHLVSVTSRFQTMEPEPQARMLEWVRKDLTAARAAKHIDWVIVFFHDAPFAEFKSGRKVLPNKVKTDLMPIVTQAAPDLVLFAGTGNYQRGAADAKPMLAAVGNGGAPLKEQAEPSPGMATLIAAHGSLLIDVKGKTLTAVMIDTAGAERDRFVLER